MRLAQYFAFAKYLAAARPTVLGSVKFSRRVFSSQELSGGA